MRNLLVLPVLLLAAFPVAAQYPYSQNPAQPQQNYLPNFYNRQTQPLSPYLNLLRGGDPGINYYYGVRPDEATASRPRYSARAGIAPEIGLYAAYSLSERWRVLAGYTLSRWPANVAESPIDPLDMAPS